MIYLAMDKHLEEFAVRFSSENLRRNEKIKQYESECDGKLAIKPYSIDEDGFIIGDGDKHWTTPSNYLAVMRYLFDQKEIFHPEGGKPILLDLGSALCNVVIYAAKHGWLSFGIEIDETCYNEGLKNIAVAENVGFMEKNSCKTALGNYFPKGFELETIIETEGERWLRESFERKIQQAVGKEPYKELGIRLDKVDLFYHFQIERRNNILRLFSGYAKKEAMLAFLAVLKETFTVPGDVRECARFDDLILYVKD
jgi:hypothetical protein